MRCVYYCICAALYLMFAALSFCAIAALMATTVVPLAVTYME